MTWTSSRKGHKYGATRTTVDGVNFHSKAEARRYAQLRLLERAGEIRDLELQPSFELMVPEAITAKHRKVGTYCADFRYERFVDGRWRRIVEDVKGVRTSTYLLKKRMVEAQYGIEIVEVAA